MDNITPEIEHMAGDAGSELSRGGMITKIEAAKIARAAGANMVIAAGKVLHPLRQLDEPCPSTWFVAPSDPVTARKRWIAGQLAPRGRIAVDAGAVTALEAGKSLLPAGVTSVSGEFDRGDLVLILAPDGREIGRGLVAYAKRDAVRIMGHKSDAIPDILGFRGRRELIHRDDLMFHRTLTAQPSNAETSSNEQARKSDG